MVKDGIVDGSERGAERREESNLERVAVRNLVHGLGARMERGWDNGARRDAKGGGGECARRFPSRPKAPQYKWTPGDDARVLAWVERHGPRRWSQLAAMVFGNARTPAQLRARYIDVLDPSRVDRAWTPYEDRTMLELYRRTGPRWTLIADELDGRVANDVKNRFRLLMRAQRSERSTVSP
uniref:Myb-like domain-containing protein n=1 Tax=Erythrolobus australicus TaxID=1077150 RepID=A0A7S1TL42_9RHOD|mmetsp:Transcript_2473/g.6686  ORF Transcript_2473/g.6686 Transcript_2473/m.6686 type:complete len:181 (+) Transcript_2473:443-985(+)